LISKLQAEEDFQASHLMRNSGQRKLQNNNILTEKMKKFSTFIGAFILAAKLFSQNPIVPPGIYIADPSAHVWKDGKIYVYGSRDESPE